MEFEESVLSLINCLNDQSNVVYIYIIEPRYLGKSCIYPRSKRIHSIIITFVQYVLLKFNLLKKKKEKVRKIIDKQSLRKISL